MRPGILRRHRCPDCFCTPSTPCDYSDDFAYLRDYEISLRATGSRDGAELSNAAALAPAAITAAIDLNQSVDPSANRRLIHEATGGGGWYVSDKRIELFAGDCITACEDEFGASILLDPYWRVWSIGVIACPQRLFCRRNPTLETPPEAGASACILTGYDETQGTATGPVGWDRADIGHLLRTVTAANASAASITLSGQLYNDPTYCTSHYRGLYNSSGAGLACDPLAHGGYWNWGFHFGAAVYEPNKVGDPATNVVRLGLDRSVEAYGSNTATLYLRIWDDSGTLTQVNLGSHTVTQATGVLASLTVTRTGSDTWDVIVSGAATHTETGVNLVLDDGINPAALPVGTYCDGTTFFNDGTSWHGGGEWGEICITGIATDDACSLCATDGLGDSWSIETTMGVGWETEDVGGCGSPTSCGVDPWSGTQTLGPWTAGSGTCCWRSCDNAFACWDDGTNIWCVPNGRPIELCTDSTPGDERLVLTYLAYTTSDGETFSPVTLAIYEASIADICGPATFTKVTDNTTGGYFPATVTATRVFTPQGCGGDDEPPGTQGQCCPEESIPETLSASVTLNSSFDGTLSITSLVHNGNGLWQGTLTITPNSPSGPCAVEELQVTLFCLYTASESASQVSGWALRIEGESDAIDATFACDPFAASFDVEKSGNCNGILFTIDVTE